MQPIPFHEAANLFPLDEEHIESLAEDIRVNGQQIPVELFDGKILDGRRRYTACQRIGVEPKTIEVSPRDPVAYVLSLNLHRRHLTPSQLSMVGARARDIYDREAKERQQATLKKGESPVPVTLPERGKGESRELAGKAVGVSGSYVDRATKVIESGTPELIKAVDEGQMSVTSAAKLAKESPDVQRAEIAKAPKPAKARRPSRPTDSANAMKPVLSPSAAPGTTNFNLPHDPVRAAAFIVEIFGSEYAVALAAAIASISKEGIANESAQPAD